MSDPPATSIPEKEMVIPPDVSQTKSYTEEVRTLGITVCVSDTNTNVTISEEMMNNEGFGTSHLDTLTISTSLVLSSTIETTVLDISTSLPPLSSPIPSSFLASTISPTFSNIVHETITTLFSSQSVEPKRLVHDEEPNDDDIMVSFADLQFDPEEDKVPNNTLMSDKQT